MNMEQKNTIGDRREAIREAKEKAAFAAKTGVWEDDFCTELYELGWLIVPLGRKR